MHAQSCLTLPTPWTVAHQAPLFMEFSGQEYWNGLTFLSVLFLCMYLEKKSNDFFKMWLNIHSSIIYNCQDTETA